MDAAKTETLAQTYSGLCIPDPPGTHLSFLLAVQVVQAAAGAIWGCATSSRTRRLLTEIGAVEALLTMLQKTLTMETAPGAAGRASPGQDGAGALPQESDRDQLQVLCSSCT